MAFSLEKMFSAPGNFIKTWLDNFSKSGMLPILAQLDQTSQAVAGLVKPFSEIQSAMIDLTKAAGLASYGIDEAAKRIVVANKLKSLSINYGLSSPEMLQLQSKIFNAIGRNVGISYSDRTVVDEAGNIIGTYKGELEDIVAAASVFGDEAVQKFAEAYDKFGRTAGDAAVAMGKLYQEAGEYGINATKYSENFLQNISMAQSYTFKKGVDGLKEMAKKATAIRQDMQQVTKFADKVGTVEGAVETAAKLQVLGGNFAALSNPLSLLHDSLTDMNSLQDTLTNFTKGLAYYDPTTHQVKLSPGERMQIKYMAEAAGLDANNLIEQALAQGRIREIERQMAGYQIDSRYVDLVKNVGKIDEETGLAGVVVNNQFRTLSELSGPGNELLGELVKENRSESDDIKAIAQSVLGIERALCGRSAYFRNEAAYNKIRPGVLGAGESQWDMVNDYVINDLRPEVYAALGNISQMFESLFTPLATGVFGFQAKTISNINGNTSFSDLGTTVRDALGSFIPEEWMSWGIGGAIMDLIEGGLDVIGATAGGMNDWLISHGKGDLLTPFKEGRPSLNNGGNLVSPAQRYIIPGLNSGVPGSAGSPVAGQPQVTIVYNYGPFGASGEGALGPSAKEMPFPLRVEPVTIVLNDGRNGEPPEYKVNLDGNFTMVVKGENGADLSKIDVGEYIKKWIDSHSGEFNDFIRTVIENDSERTKRQGTSGHNAG